jgi:hypothetical protein
MSIDSDGTAGFLIPLRCLMMQRRSWLSICVCTVRFRLCARCARLAHICEIVVFTGDGKAQATALRMSVKEPQVYVFFCFLLLCILLLKALAKDDAVGSRVLQEEACEALNVS